MSLSNRLAKLAADAMVQNYPLQIIGLQLVLRFLPGPRRFGTT